MHRDKESEMERERDRDRGIDIERERPTDRNFLSSLCLLCSLAGLAALPARLLCWLRLAVLACLLLACQMVCISTHTFTHFFINTFFYTAFSIQSFSIHVFSIQHDFLYTTRPRSFPDSKVTLYLVFLHILIHDRELFFYIQAVLDTLFLYRLFYTTFF